MDILFIGNSYTYYNDMPEIFESLARDNGKEVTVFSVTKGGRFLYEFKYCNDECTQKLEDVTNGKIFDICFLQEQSILPIKDYDKFLEGVSYLAKKLSRSVDSFVMYSTWSRKEGHSKLYELGITADKMTDNLYRAYNEAANVIGASVSPVGLSFAEAVKNKCCELYIDDSSSHPTYAGSCLAALTHYYAVFGEYPKNTSALKIEEADLDIFRSAVLKGFDK